MGFTEERVSEGAHICLLFNDDRERLQVMARFLESGITEGERILYLADTMTPEEMLDCLESLGVEARSQAGFRIEAAASAYCPTGTFDADEMMAGFREFYLQSLDDGCPGARVTGEMSWGLVEGRTDMNALMGYEARLNGFLEEYPCTACCQYDTRRFDGDTIMDVLSVHPMTIVRGQLVKNPFFVDPRLFLEELNRRQAAE